MIAELQLKNWKSFAEATLSIDVLMFLIGTNASGKSNVLDALGFLRNLAEGIQLRDCVSSVRGGEDWIIRYGQKSFLLSVTIKEDDYSYRYSIEIGKDPKAFTITNEKLERQFKRSLWKPLFMTDVTDPAAPTIATRFYTGKRGSMRKLELLRGVSILSQIDYLQVLKEIKDSARVVTGSLKRVFILNPNPDSMRSYSALSQVLRMDAANIAGVLAGMDEETKREVETKLTQFVRPLPEKDVDKIWASKVGLYSTDAMLYCDERWAPSNLLHLDARGMSDGTLRFIAIVAALLIVEPNSLLVIEEIDNGLHPSRSDELVKVLTTIGEERHVDVLCTTHNPVLIDTLGNRFIAFISYVERDENGDSTISLIEDIPELAKKMASSSIGGLMIKGCL